MTTNNETQSATDQQTSPTGEPLTPQTAQPEQDPQTANDQGGETPNREAAKYRRKLREAEEASQALTEQLKTAQRSLLDTLLAAPIEIDHPTGQGKTLVQLHQAEDVFTLSNKTLEDFTTSHGDIDSTALARAVADLYSQRPELFVPQRQRPNPRVSQSPPFINAQTSWKDALKPKPQSLN